MAERACQSWTHIDYTEEEKEHAMLDLRNAGMGLLASSSLLLTAPVMPGSCTGTNPGTGGVGGGPGRPDAFCGNGRQEGNELCDGADLGDLTSDCTRYDSSGYFTEAHEPCS